MYSKNEKSIVKIKSWNELHEILFKDWYNEKIGRYRAPQIFRGLSDYSYKLTTNLMRLGGPYKILEPYLLMSFKRYSGLETLNFDSLWYWMILGQHYGLPTRLLDWSHSPLVAMHFATSNIRKFDVDGVIWVVNFSKTGEFLPKILKDTATKLETPIFPFEALDDALNISGDMRSLKTLTEAFKKLNELSESEFVVFLEPPSIDDRIKSQVALFSFMSDPSLSMDDWLKMQNIPGLWKKIIIPAELKVEIRDKLDRMNVSERLLFPGLDGLCKLLARHYATIQ
ncbi:MAG: FRG domain-containing protein [Promethearchaeota archaeon]